MGFYLNVQNNKIISASNEPINKGAIKSYSVEENIYYDYISNEDKYMVDNNKIIVNPDYATKKAEQREKEFNTQFFDTSLGYIRRKVTMANGEIKDFLTDLLPSISLGISLNPPVTIICYTQPDFSKDVEDWTKYQQIKQATPQFVQECFMQLNKDFVGEQVIEETYKQTNETTENQEKGGTNEEDGSTINNSDNV